MEHGDQERKPDGFGLWRTNIVLIGFIAIAAFYLLTEHRAHLLGWLPYLLFLACPLMHLFMHHGHGGGGHGETAGRNEPDRERNASSHHH
jgi:hypothetical protein